MIANFFYGFHVHIFNCTFISNEAFFSGIISSNNFVSNPAILNITNIVALYSYAIDKVLGLEFTAGGAFGGSGYGGNSFFYFNDCKFMYGYAQKGLLEYFLYIYCKKF